MFASILLLLLPQVLARMGGPGDADVFGPGAVDLLVRNVLDEAVLLRRIKVRGCAR